VFGILNIAYALGMMAGPVLGSGIVELFGIRAALAAMGLAFGAFALSVGQIRTAR
jgi:hypothetical protein